VIAARVGAPVDEGKRGEDNVGRKEVIGIGEEARGGDGPDVPVEAIEIDISTDLVAFVIVGLLSPRWRWWSAWDFDSK
jgi:hypothetical protein